MKLFYKDITLFLVSSILILSIFSFPQSSFAEGNNFLPVIRCGAEDDPCTFADAIDTINRLVNWFVSIAATIASITIAYAGAQILLNPSNPGKLEEAKKMFNKTLLGLFWLLAAWLIIYTIINRFVSSDVGALRFLKI